MPIPRTPLFHLWLTSLVLAGAALNGRGATAQEAGRDAPTATPAVPEPVPSLLDRQRAGAQTDLAIDP
ncbi:MAG: hypothetical protein ACKOJF_05770, partial [Planctomycetaceae bacterium]